MKKLLVFHPVIAPYRIDFFNSLSEAFDSHICMFWRNLRDQTFNYSNIEKQFLFQPTYLDKTWKIGKLQIPKGIFSTLKHDNPDIVLVAECGLKTVLVVLYKFLLRKSFKIVAMIDDSYSMAVEGEQFSRWHHLAEKILIPTFDEVIVVEPRVATFFQQKYGKGVYFPIIASDEKKRENYKSILPLSNSYQEKYNLKGKKVLLFVGRCVPLKNVAAAIRAFKKAKVPDTVFVIVGDGPELDGWQKEADEDDRFIFTGRLEGDELNAWYNVADVHILASWQEAFGAVTNEALLGGCYSLVSTKAGSQCLIKEGVNGYTLNPYDEEDMAKKMKTVFEVVKERTCPLVLRDSRMQESFNEGMRRLITTIQ